MADILLSGPAGSNKSAVAREALAAATGLSIAADFQALYSALLLLERGPDGRYPARVEALLPLIEFVRRAVITGARSREIGIIATNSDGDPARRALLLSELGAGATERVIDPGEGRCTRPPGGPGDRQSEPRLWASDQPVVQTPDAGPVTPWRVTRWLRKMKSGLRLKFGPMNLGRGQGGS